MKTLLYLLGAIPGIVGIIIGISTIAAFIEYKRKKDPHAIEQCRSHVTLAISIVLLLIIPASFFIYVLTHEMPEGRYETIIDYSVSGLREEKDELTGEYNEIFFEKEGRAPLTIYNAHLSYEVPERDNNKVIVESRFEACQITLDCFNMETFDLGERELFPNSDSLHEIYFGGSEYDLILHLGDLNDKTLGYTLEKRISDVSVFDWIIYSLSLFLDIIGIIGFFVSEKMGKSNTVE